jgi:hypothetical protein
MITRSPDGSRIHDYRFRPRFRGLAIGAIGLGGVLAATTFVIGIGGLVAGAVGAALGGLYLASPAWKITVRVDDDAIEVVGRFRLPWADVKEVVASPTTHTCFVDGGTPDRSLLVPGDGAPAPYDIEDKVALYEAILAHVAGDRVRTVEVLQP